MSMFGTTLGIPAPRRMITVLLKTDKSLFIWEPEEGSVTCAIIAFVLNMNCLKISSVK